MEMKRRSLLLKTLPEAKSMKSLTRFFTLGFVAIILIAVSTSITYVQSANGKIVFDTLGAGSVEIYVMNSDGSNQTKLTSSGGMHPTWSPDGRKIAFVKSPQSGYFLGDIYVMNEDGSNPVNITKSSSNEDYPSWSPDGSMIAFSDGSAIKVMNPNGGNVKTVVSGAKNKASWAPDSSRIAFTKMNGETGSLEIHTIDLDGRNLRKLTNGGTVSYPAWSPDGSKIAFISSTNERLNLPGYSGNVQYQIFVMNADGSNQREVTFDSTHFFSVDWSPDGTNFVCQGDDIYVVNATSGAKTKLTSNRYGANRVPEW
jgi:TolB protein